MSHRGFAIEQGFVEVDVNQVGSVLHLLTCNGKRSVEIVAEDELLELGRTGDVGALPDHQESDIRGDAQWLQPGVTRKLGQLRNPMRGVVLDALGKQSDVFRLENRGLDHPA